MTQDKFTEEMLEMELENSGVWDDFGRILSDAHRSVYVRPNPEFQLRKAQESQSRVPRRFARFHLRNAGWAVSAAVLLLAGIVIGWFARSGIETREEITCGFCWEDEADLDWEAGENELVDFDSLLEQVQNDGASVDLEIAILEDSLGEWSSESAEEWF
ncbi:MAG: hypothetical protein E7028_03170 [Planctomycetaceae bacterium]|nr:hypothetical protein [Planctomycetaceae bacterium]